MTGWTDDDYEVECPHDDCTNQLDLIWTHAYGLHPDDPRDGIAVTEAHSWDWKVECRAGHVVLLPTEDIDEDGDDSEGSRSFRAADRARLNALLTPRPICTCTKKFGHSGTKLIDIAVIHHDCPTHFDPSRGVSA